MWYFILLLLSSLNLDSSSGECKVYAEGSIMFMEIPEKYYIIAQPGNKYNIKLEGYLANQSIKADIKLYELGVLKIYYSEDENLFKYSILGMNHHRKIDKKESVFELLDKKDLENSIKLNLIKIVEIIIRNSFGEEALEAYKPITNLEVNSVKVNCN